MREGQGSSTEDCWWDRAGWGPPAVNRWALLLTGGRRHLGTHQDGNAVFLAVHSSFRSPSKVTSSSAGQLRRRKRRRKRLHQDSTKGHGGRGNSASPYYMHKEGWPTLISPNQWEKMLCTCTYANELILHHSQTEVLIFIGKWREQEMIFKIQPGWCILLCFLLKRQAWHLS